MFFFKYSFWKLCQCLLSLIVFSTILVREACLMTGVTCRKSPPRSNALPPNGLSDFIIFLSIRSIASKAWSGAMGASSHMITDASLSVWAALLFKDIDEFDVSFKSSGSLKTEWTVRPPIRIVAAMPVQATDITSFCSPLSMWRRVL